MRQQWERIRASLFGDAAWFARSPADIAHLDSSGAEVVRKAPYERAVRRLSNAGERLHRYGAAASVNAGAR